MYKRVTDNVTGILHKAQTLSPPPSYTNSDHHSHQLTLNVLNGTKYFTSNRNVTEAWTDASQIYIQMLGEVGKIEYHRSREVCLC